MSLNISVFNSKLLSFICSTQVFLSAKKVKFILVKCRIPTTKIQKVRPQLKRPVLFKKAIIVLKIVLYIQTFFLFFNSGRCVQVKLSFFLGCDHTKIFRSRRKSFFTFFFVFSQETFYLSVSFKPDHSQGKPSGNFFIGRIPHPSAAKNVRNLDP